VNRFLWPLIGFIVLVVFLGVGLTLNPSEVPSPLVDKPAPRFALPLLANPEEKFASTEMDGKVWLLNVWASWCTACLEEHPIMTELANSGVAPIVGLNYKDPREDALAWLRRHGDPYLLSVADTQGRVAIDFGVYGVPETFVIDKSGVIRYKHIGPVTAQAMRDKILPLLLELQK
jgi:cytochrome c biogenesis protein CcmG/thiol:disulfide interchange protein DsbE